MGAERIPLVPESRAHLGACGRQARSPVRYTRAHICTHPAGHEECAQAWERAGRRRRARDVLRAAFANRLRHLP